MDESQSPGGHSAGCLDFAGQRQADTAEQSRFEERYAKGPITVREHRAANIRFGIRLADVAADTEQRKDQVVATVGWTAAPVESPWYVKAVPCPQVES